MSEETTYCDIVNCLDANDFRAAKTLLDGFDINFRCPSRCIDVDKETLLFDYARNDNLECIKLLLGLGINPWIKNSLGYMAIHNVRWDKPHGLKIGELIVKKMREYNDGA